MTAESAPTIRVLIADESSRITGNLVRRLSAEADIEVAAIVHDGDNAVQEALRTRPDVAIVDAGLPGLDGSQTTEMLAQYLPRTGVIMLSLNAENEAYRRAMLAGAREFLQKPFTGDELVAAIRRVHSLELRKTTTPSKETPAERRGKVYTVFAGKGGVGKSVVAVNLAVSLGQHARVVVLDCSLQFGDVAALLNVTPERTVVDLAAGNAVADSEVIHQVLAPGPGGIRVLAAPASPELADYVTTQHLTALVDELRRSFDCIVIDTASHLGEIGLDAVELADRVLLVTDLSVTSVKNAKLARAVMEVLKVEPERFLLVLNHREANGEMDRAHAEQFIDLHATAEIPYDAAVVSVSVSRGVPFVLSSPDSTPATRIAELARLLSSGLETGGADGAAEAERSRKPRRLLGLGRR